MDSPSEGLLDWLRMIEFYPEIRLVHVAAVLTSGALFAVRGAALFAGVHAGQRVLRHVSYAVDTVLLTAALILMTIVRQYPFEQSWLTVKVLLLVVYIGLGITAFRLRANINARVGLWLAALAVYVFIFTVARAHHPLGYFSGAGS